MRALLLAAAAVVFAGCGDGPICQSQILLVIQSPDGVVLGDSNAALAGVQTQVHVRSTLPEGIEVTLEVLGAGDVVLSNATATVDADGNATFDDVTLPDGAQALEASADAGECGSSQDQVPIQVGAGVACDLSIRQTPLEIAYYAPLAVLNSTSDVNPVTAGFQGNVDVVGHGGDQVEILVTDANGVEVSAGHQIAASDGSASFDVTLADGREAVRAICRGTDDVRTSSTVTVFVDTEAPSCMLMQPFPGTTLTPGLDRNGDTSDGLQLDLAGHADGTDLQGELSSFSVTTDGATTTLVGGELGANGDATTTATVAPTTVPGSATIAFRAHDHAGNTCIDSVPFDVVYDGCNIAVTAPSGPLTSDADGNPANGTQVDVALAVDPACAGQTVVSSCGLDSPSTTVAGDGSAQLRVDWCSSDPCEHTAGCTFTVTTPGGVATTAGALIEVDDKPPSVAVQIVQPGVACGATVTSSDDIDGNPSNGVQIEVRVVAPDAVSRSVAQSDASGTTVSNASSDVRATISAGTTTFVGTASDAVGNTGHSPPCEVTLGT